MQTLKQIAFPYFKEIGFYNDPDDGAAKSLRSKARLMLNLYWWKRIPDEHKLFVLWHEEGHIILNTVDEMNVDEYASNKYFEHGLREIDSIQALTRLLKKENPVHNARAFLQYQRALQHEYEVDGNPKAYRNHYTKISEIKQQLQNVQRS